MYKPLQDGDEIRVVAPSQSYNKKKEAQYQRAKQRLEKLGYRVTFGNHIKDVALLGTADARERAQDLNEAFADAKVQAVMVIHGGWSANEVLPLLDWDVIKQNPKPLLATRTRLCCSMQSMQKLVILAFLARISVLMARKSYGSIY